MQPGQHHSSPILPSNYILILEMKDCFFQFSLAQQDQENFAFKIWLLNVRKPAKRYLWIILCQE